MICDVAIDEFAEYSYEQASINRIVANAGIAKGSFYQYFDDKEDLFLYIMSIIAEEKIESLSPIIHNPEENDLFCVIREMFLSGVRFAKEHPRYAAIGNRLLADKQAPIYRELQSESRPASLALFEPLLKKAIERGEVRDDIDINMLNYIISSMNVSIVEYFSDKDPEALYDTVVDSVDGFVDILRKGIGAQRMAS